MASILAALGNGTVKNPILIVPDPAVESWARLRAWCAALRDRTPHADTRDQATALARILDAWIDQRRSPILAKKLAESVDLLRLQLIELGFTPPEFSPARDGFQ